ncbi:uncharacterized protein LOC129607985 [Condylostylus longicornis]|uniref:uncharacterized protein LOC129607985 n=1 Tax=Condylostylus longicornis TaxID=2530218 RepID=UPI00244E0542|nr:uncharacterized protein LOC129607985 [Condylostylus longicornis]
MGNRKPTQILFCLLLFCTINLTTSQNFFNVPSAFINGAESVVESKSKPEAQETTTEIPVSQGFPTINFGNKNISIFLSNETIYENGTSSLRFSLSNGIGFNINSEPKEENGMKFYVSSGTFEFRTPDSFSYIIEFEAEPKNFTLVNFERKNKVLQRANPKILAALAGR